MAYNRFKTNDLGHLEIGGIDSTELVKKYGTPLYVYDESLIESNINSFKDNFFSNVINTEIIYASKAFLTLEMVRLLEKNNLSLDVVSGGEIYTAYKAGFNMKNLYFHGNNKSFDEIKMAIDLGVGTIIVDNIIELEMIANYAKSVRKVVDTLFRVNPGYEAHTHKYIVTAKLDSKFGESVFDEDKMTEIMSIYNESDNVILHGFHCHIGSQIFGQQVYLETVVSMINFTNKTEKQYKRKLTKINFGGGFGISYTDSDNPIPLDKMLTLLVCKIEEEVKNKQSNINTIMIEPGRAIIGNAGLTLYKVGAYKETFTRKKYIFVDGGMTDNIRPALYEAKYSADIANKMNEEKCELVTIAGKCCESGDVLIEDILMQRYESDDILAVYATGAYGFSMASNYNKLLRPAVVFVKDGEARTVVKRQTYEDLIRSEV